MCLWHQNQQQQQSQQAWSLSMVIRLVQVYGQIEDGIIPIFLNLPVSLRKV
jgi:hypothetical protein